MSIPSQSIPSQSIPSQSIPSQYITDNILQNIEPLPGLKLCKKIIINGNGSTSLIVNDRLFQSFGELEEIEFPNNLETLVLKNYLFEECKNLKSVIFPNNLKSLIIHQGSFQGCPSLNNGDMFKNMRGLKQLTLGNYLFQKNQSLTSMAFPDNLEILEIRDGAFEECINLNSIIFPTSIKTLIIKRSVFNNVNPAFDFNNMFKNMPNLTTLVLGDFLLENRPNLSMMEFPSKLEFLSLGQSIFQNTSISSLTLPNTIKHLTIETNEYITQMNVPTSLEYLNLDNLSLPVNKNIINSINSLIYLQTLILKSGFFDGIDNTTIIFPDTITNLTLGNSNTIKGNVNLQIPKKINLTLDNMELTSRNYISSSYGERMDVRSEFSPQNLEKLILNFDNLKATTYYNLLQNVDKLSFTNHFELVGEYISYRKYEELKTELDSLRASLKNQPMPLPMPSPPMPKLSSMCSF